MIHKDKNKLLSVDSILLLSFGILISNPTQHTISVTNTFTELVNIQRTTKQLCHYTNPHTNIYSYRNVLLEERAKPTNFILNNSHMQQYYGWYVEYFIFLFFFCLPTYTFMDFQFRYSNFFILFRSHSFPCECICSTAWNLEPIQYCGCYA